MAEFYFKHRLSEDLDLFSTDEFPLEEIENFSVFLAKKLKAKIEIQRRTGFIRYTFNGAFGQLKVDFVHQIFKQLESHKKVGRLQIASLFNF